MKAIFNFFSISLSGYAFFIALLLISLLPWHAFLVTSLSHLLLNSHNDFLPKTALILASWKEILIFILGIIVLCQTWQHKKIPIKLIKFDYYFLAFLLIALLSGLFFTQNLAVILWGLKYDFSFLVLFYLIRSSHFSNQQINTIFSWFYWSAGLVIVWGILTYQFLPPDFLQNFGYSSHISSFDPNKPLPMFHAVEGGTPRLASTFSGPNQFGFYLIIVIGFTLSAIINIFTTSFPNKKSVQLIRWQLNNNKKLLGLIILFILASYALFLTFSRSAWLGVLAIILGQFLALIPTKYLGRWLLGLLISTIISGGVLYFFTPQFFHTTIIRANSSNGHYIRTIGAIKQVIAHPLGTGLGTAGPASVKFAQFKNTYVLASQVDQINNIPEEAYNHIWFANEIYEKDQQGNFTLIDNDIFGKDYLRQNDANIYLRFKPTNDQELKAIPAIKALSPILQTKIIKLWQANYQERIAENWYIQMFQEFGYLGGLVYLLMMWHLLKYLFLKCRSHFLFKGALMSLIGLMIAGLFLHSFEDSASSLSLFLLIGLVITPEEKYNKNC